MTGSNWSGESVVIPANKYPHCVQLVRSFGRRGIHTIVATDSMEWGRAPSLCSRYCDEAIHTPSPSVHLTEFKNSLLSLAERPDVRTITPIKEEDSYVLSKYRSEFSDHVDTLAPSFDILRQVQDRVLLVKAANEAGVPTPDTQILSEVEDWDRDVIIKTRYTVLTNEYVESVPSTVCRKVQPVKQIPAGTEPDVEAIQAEMGHDPVVQEFIRGAEFSVRAICDHGEPIATSIKRQLRGQSYGGGFSAYREPVELPKLEELTNSLLKELNWHGPCSVQFIGNEDSGDYRLTEVNPRFWGSLTMDVRAGIDYPYYFWLLSGGQSVVVNPDYKTGIKTHHLSNELRYIDTVLRENLALTDRPKFSDAIKEVGWSSVRYPHFDFFSIDDPKPLVQDLWNSLGVYKGW